MSVSCSLSQASLVAIVVPDQEYFAEWANAHGFAGGMEELCANAVSIHTYIHPSIHTYMYMYVYDYS